MDSVRRWPWNHARAYMRPVLVFPTGEVEEEGREDGRSRGGIGGGLVAAEEGSPARESYVVVEG